MNITKVHDCAVELHRSNGQAPNEFDLRCEVCTSRVESSFSL